MAPFFNAKEQQVWEEWDQALGVLQVEWQCLGDGWQSWQEQSAGRGQGARRKRCREGSSNRCVRSRKWSLFFSMQLFCSVFANLNHRMWWLLALWGVSWGITITVVMCWMFLHPTEREEKANQCLERKSCCSQTALCDLLKKKDYFYMLALTYQGKNWGGIGCMILTLCDISISSIMVTLIYPFSVEGLKTFPETYQQDRIFAGGGRYQLSQKKDIQNPSESVAITFYMDKVTWPSRLSQCVQLSALTNTSLGFQKSKVIAWMSNLTLGKRCSGIGLLLSKQCTEK